jgi:DnaJ-class molecular chaperone
MPDLLEMYKACEVCAGTGKVFARDLSKEAGDKSQHVGCDSCKGTGRYLWGWYQEGGPPE